jgi:mannosyl-3-phosphoglycerate phosphatase
MGKSFLIFTDLDGTLLDEETYDSREAGEALACIRRLKIPLIFCSSKTRAEMEVHRKILANRDPFIVENGGAVFIPKGWFDLTGQSHFETETYAVIALGEPYKRIINYFTEIKAETGLRLMGFSDMPPARIALTTGLAIENAALARTREYTEPFMVMGEMTETVMIRLDQAVRKRGLRMVRGGRFFHLMGGNDKGKAVQVLKMLYQKKGGTLISIGLGDSPNDFPMLENVDYPVLVRRASNQVSVPSRPAVHYTSGIGPRGWNEAVLLLLKEVCHE